MTQIPISLSVSQRVLVWENKAAAEQEIVCHQVAPSITLTDNCIRVPVVPYLVFEMGGHTIQNSWYVIAMVL